MYTKVELLDAINELNGGRHTIQNCERLAAVYTVLNNQYPADHLPQIESGYSTSAGETVVGNHGNSEFLSLVAGIDTDKAWLMMDELMVTLQVLNPQLYRQVISKLKTM